MVELCICFWKNPIRVQSFWSMRTNKTSNNWKECNNRKEVVECRMQNTNITININTWIYEKKNCYEILTWDWFRSIICPIFLSEFLSRIPISQSLSALPVLKTWNTEPTWILYISPTFRSLSTKLLSLRSLSNAMT